MFEREVRLVKRDVQVARLHITDLLLLFLMVWGISVAFDVLKPYLDAILLAGLFAIIVNPVHQKMLAFFGGRRSLVAFLTALLLTIVVVVPCFLVTWQLLQEAAALSQTIEPWLHSDELQAFMKKPVVVQFMTSVNLYVAEFRGLTMGQTPQDIPINQMAIDIATSLAKRVLDQGSYIVGHAVSLLGNFLLMICAFFFMIRDQEQLRQNIFVLLPFTRGHEDEIRLKVVSVSRSTFLSIFLTALAQGMGAAVGFWVTGIPVLLGSFAAAFASLIPVVGTGVVWLPATLYLLFADKVGSAIFLSIWWAAVVVFLSDNLLRPVLMGGGAGMSMPLVFFFMMGGIHLFGPLGVLYGPLILGALYILFYLYDLTIAAPGIKPSKEEGRV
jgi:predicted PurR-regulated permease PerM